MVHDSMHVKRPEQTCPQTQKADQQVPGAEGVGQGVSARGDGVSFRGSRKYFRMR